MDSTWTLIAKHGKELWIGGKKVNDGKFKLAGVEFEISMQTPVKAELYIRPVRQQEVVRSWEM
jgi:hypothetical protein